MTIDELFNLKGKVAVVTGASEGIGRELALGLAAAGAEIVLCSRNEDKLTEVRKAIHSIGGKAEVFGLDVSNLDNILQLRTFILKNFNRLDILITDHPFKGWFAVSPIRACYWLRLKAWFRKPLLLATPKGVLLCYFSLSSIRSVST